MKLDTFTQAYIECALWSTTDNECRCANGKILELERRKGELDRYGRDRMPLTMCAELDEIANALTRLEHDSDCGRETGGEPLDKNYRPEDIDLRSLHRMIEDCANFKHWCREALAESKLSDEQAGHDLWLTRNGHGAGFWDRGLPAAIDEELSNAARAMGSVDLYVGDDGKVYQS